MKKRISQLSSYKFAIKQVIKGHSITYLPVVKEPGFFKDWTPIVRIYDHYIAMPYEHPEGLTQNECLKHILKYKEVLSEKLTQAKFHESYEVIEVNDIESPTGTQNS